MFMLVIFKILKGFMNPGKKIMDTTFCVKKTPHSYLKVLHLSNMVLKYFLSAQAICLKNLFGEIDIFYAVNQMKSHYLM
jgi:hypothetical protein